MRRSTFLYALLGAAMPASAESLIEGKADSPVRVLIYEDLQCSDCAAFRKMLDEVLLPKYGAKVAFEHRDFPLPKHSWARLGAIASRHFESVGAAVAISWRRELMRDQAKVTADSFPTYLQAFARKQGLDPAKAVAAMADPKLSELVASDYEDGVARGIARTPTALVNGTPFIETFTAEQISAGIDKALAESGVK